MDTGFIKLDVADHVALVTMDSRVAMRAFVEKRPPVFKGR
jgi:hypothetical protein